MLGRVRDFKLGLLIDRAKSRINSIKASRATERGIAGHQAAMNALKPKEKNEKDNNNGSK